MSTISLIDPAKENEIDFFEERRYYVGICRLPCFLIMGKAVFDLNDVEEFLGLEMEGENSLIAVQNIGENIVITLSPDRIPEQFLNNYNFQIERIEQHFPEPESKEDRNRSCSS